jgi:beta-galactosidase
VTNSINGLLSVLDQIVNMMHNQVSGDLNSTMANAGDMMKQAQATELVTKLVAESFAVVDIAGYNYADNRYVMDKELFPNRIIVGSETFPRDITNNWKLVKEHGHVIGDFTWTGWDYLGEVGIGKPYREEGVHDMSGNYPWLIAYCGDIDITGHRRPASYYREIVFGLRKEPYIAVQRPEQFGKPPVNNPWSWSDSISSWSWEGHEGKTIIVEVYSDADEVELLLNGEPVGRAGAGEVSGYKAVFETVYAPGELTAVAYTSGSESGRMTLRSAGVGVNLKAEADRSQIVADDHDLAFVSISFVDNEGILKPLSERKVTVTVGGAGFLLGFGSAKPKTEESYTDHEHTTYNGRALAVIRPTGEGKIRVAVEAEGCSPQVVEIEAVRT